ncbi:hypothetical protein ACP4OV_007426 [Aristida adscensionis]
MEMMCGAAAATTQLPPGFRFHPTDEELILHYLRNRAASAPCPVPIIADVDIYKFDPWDLPTSHSHGLLLIELMVDDDGAAKAAYGDGEWYFFSPRDRKYPNGIRPNRAAGSGYWKATGTDKPIHDTATGEGVGVKKALVFYKGRPPKGSKTNWIMHEYRLAAAGNPLAAAAAYRPPVKFRNVSMRLDDWVLCRIYKKTGQASPMVPPLADYDHLDNDSSSGGGGGGGGYDDICGYYGAGGATVPPSGTTASSVITHHHQQQQQAAAPPARQWLPKTPSFSDLYFDEYALAQIFDTAAAAPAETAGAEHVPLAVHPSLNQLLAVGDATAYSEVPCYYSPSPAGGKRKAAGPEECAAGVAGHSPPAKRLNGSCFDATPQPVIAATAPSVLGGGLNHHMLPQF